jgi:hypothetical protein
MSVIVCTSPACGSINPSVAVKAVGDVVVYHGSIAELRHERAFIISVYDGRYTLSFGTGDVADRVRPQSVSHCPVDDADIAAGEAIRYALMYDRRRR